MKCKMCPQEFPARRGAGRPAVYCSAECKRAAKTKYQKTYQASGVEKYQSTKGHDGPTTVFQGDMECAIYC